MSEQFYFHEDPKNCTHINLFRHLEMPPIIYLWIIRQVYNSKEKQVDKDKGKIKGISEDFTGAFNKTAGATCATSGADVNLHGVIGDTV